MSFSDSESEYDASEGTDDESSRRAYGNLKATLINQIARVKAAGSFATFGLIKDFQLPGVSLLSKDPVRIPLSIDDAQDFIQASHQAPFGKGTETIIDENVRKTWQIDANNIEFHNPKWQECLDSIVATAATGLGVEGGMKNVRADLYKMLIYEQGAMFKTHKDTEKVSGMFGTLVICLQSTHTGGLLRLQHGGETAEFATSAFAPYNATFMAWYADVNHEIEPIQSGFRWVLTYNLIYTGQTSSLSAGILQARVHDFVDALHKWQRSKKRPQFLVYPLSYQYTNESLRTSYLKGQDSHTVKYISQACTQHGAFQVLVANMELCVTDDQNEEAFDDDKPKKLYLTRIVDLERSDFSIYERLCIPDSTLIVNVFDGEREPDAQTGGGYTGNQHAEIDQFYKDSVVIIVLNEYFDTFLLGGDYSYRVFQSLLSRLEPRAVFHNSNSRALLMLICKKTLDRTNQNDSHILGCVAVAAVVLGEVAFFTEAVEKASLAFEAGSYKELGKLITFKDDLFDRDMVMGALTMDRRMNQILQNVESFRAGYLDGNPDRNDVIEVKQMQMWLSSVIVQSLGSLVDVVSEHDAPGLANIFTEHQESSPFTQFLLYQAVREFVDRFTTVPAFLIPFTVELLVRVGTPAEQKYHEALLSRFIKLMIGQFELETYANYMEKGGRYHGTTAMTVKLYAYVEAFDCILPSLLLTRIGEQVFSLPEANCKSFLLQFLSGIMRGLSIASAPDPARQCVFNILKAYLIQTVGHEPKKPHDWSRPEEMKACYKKKCEPCDTLREFLQDPSTEETRVSGLEKYHFAEYYPYVDVKETTEAGSLVTKTLKHWAKKHKDWESRCEVALKWINKLPTDKLKELLLPKQYDGILALECIRDMEPAEPEAERDEKSHHHDLPSLVPQKRSASDSF